MDMRPLSPTYTVSPQIDAGDMAAIADAGFVRVICNRPDAENPPNAQHQMMREAAQAAGIDLVYLPFTHDTLTDAVVAAQRDAIDSAGGPVFAYCASGTRCSIVWSLIMAGQMSADDILGATAAQGYDLSWLRPLLEARSA